MLFKLVPLLLSSLFFSYVVGIPAHRPGTSATGVTHVENTLSLSREEVARQIRWNTIFRALPKDRVLKRGDIVQLPRGLAYFTVKPPPPSTSENPEPEGTFSRLVLTDIAEKDGIPPISMINLKFIEHPDLKRYSVLIYPILLRRVNTWRIMEEGTAAKVRTYVSVASKYILEAVKRPLPVDISSLSDEIGNTGLGRTKRPLPIDISSLSDEIGNIGLGRTDPQSSGPPRQVKPIPQRFQSGRPPLHRNPTAYPDLVGSLSDGVEHMGLGKTDGLQPGPAKRMRLGPLKDGDIDMGSPSSEPGRPGKRSLVLEGL